MDNSQSIVTGSSTSGTTDTTIVNSVSTQPKSLNFETMQNRLGGAPITLKFGGLDWTVVYATTNTTAGTNTSAGDLVVTLWANDNIPNTSAWSTTASDNVSVAYPTNVYSYSLIRVKTLNAGGDDGSNARTGVPSPASGSAYYATSTASRTGTVALEDRKTNQFAKYTLSNKVLTTTEDKVDDKGNKVIGNDGNPVKVTKKPSLTSFLTVPKNVAYQKAENWVWSYMGKGSPCILPNEAWGSGANGPDVALKHTLGTAQGGWLGPSSAARDTSAYFEWGDDYLWLPSLTETGYYSSAKDYGMSLWGIPTLDVIMNSTALSDDVKNVSWLRSCTGNSASLSYNLTSTGGYYCIDLSAEGMFRPALHLNLSAAFEKAAILAEDTKVTYNGAGQDVKSEEWYDEDLLEDTSIVTGIKYNDKDSVPLPSASPLPKEVGEYEVVFTLTSTTPYKFSGAPTSKIKKAKFIIEPKELQVDFSLDP
ncbi:MAG: hypothetical protein K2N74_01590, partial [Clostridiales bacterium]|nr:hypothetical protein [Clostridiales bacterium]